MSLEHLMQVAAQLEPAELAEVIDLAAYYQARHGEGERGSALLSQVASDDMALSQLEAMIQAGRDAVARGEVIDGPTAMAALRAKYRVDGQ